jgi:hypothetical protein
MVGSRKKLKITRIYHPHFQVSNGIQTEIEGRRITKEILFACSIHHPSSTPIKISIGKTLLFTNEGDSSNSVVYEDDCIIQLNGIIKKTKINKNLLSINTLSKYCHNIKNNHKNNHIFFILDIKQKHLYQKCFCTCENHAKSKQNIKCKDFTSRPIKIPLTLYYKLLA